ncbi:hypothetical protein APHAL10511_000495 [Amanita phalloides]|nr:hypothetical protein APHAL10511_000495 [Amanita phalloides]
MPFYAFSVRYAWTNLRANVRTSSPLPTPRSTRYNLSPPLFLHYTPSWSDSKNAQLTILLSRIPQIALAPCWISHVNSEFRFNCGHVFCLECIQRVSPPECPLCRTPYVPGSWLKLHVDMSALCLAGADKESRRFQEAIGEVTNQGSSESYLRQLINECRSFLQGQPRSMYADLRVTCRVVSYLCEVKSTLRSQSALVESLKAENAQLMEEKGQLLKLEDLEEQVALLAADKSDLEGRLEASEAARDKDKEVAVDMESKLKEHVSRAENAYQTLLDRYSCVVQEYASLNQELKDLRLKLYDHPRSVTESANPGGLSRSPPRSTNAEEPVLGFNQSRIQPSPCSQVPEPYIFLPESVDMPRPTSASPTSTTQEATVGIEGDEEVYSRKKLVRCSSADHPRSCQCDDEQEYSSGPSPSYPKRPSMSKPAFIIEHANPASRRRESLSVPVGPEFQSGLSRTAPKNQEHGNYPDRTRIRSFSDVSPIPTRPPSRSQSGRNDDNRPPSEPVSRSESPIPVSSSLGREGSIHISTPQTQTQTDSVRRLYNILQKPQSQISSSPPEFSSSYGSTHKPRRSGSRSPSLSRSRTGSTASHNQAPLTSATAPPSNAQSTHSAPYSQPAIPQPSVISRASDAAMAIEKSQKERQMAEKALRDKEREKEKREHRKSSEKDTERQEGERAVRKSVPGRIVASSPSQGGTHHTPCPSGSPHRESYVTTPSLSSASASAVNTSIQKTSTLQKTSTSPISHSLGRKNSMKTPVTTYPRHSPESQRDNVSYQSQSYRHGSGSTKSATPTSMHNTSTTPPISV